MAPPGDAGGRLAGARSVSTACVHGARQGGARAHLRAGLRHCCGKKSDDERVLYNVDLDDEQTIKTLDAYNYVLL